MATRLEKPKAIDIGRELSSGFKRHFSNDPEALGSNPHLQDWNTLADPVKIRMIQANAEKLGLTKKEKLDEVVNNPERLNEIIEKLF